MKGSPLLQFRLVLVATVALGLLVFATTRPTPRAVPVAQAQPTPGQMVEIWVEASAQVVGKILLEGQAVYQGQMGEGRVLATVGLPPAGADFVVEAKAADAARFAVRLLVREDGDILAEETFWGDGTLVGVLEVEGQL